MKQRVLEDGTDNRIRQLSLYKWSNVGFLTGSLKYTMTTRIMGLKKETHPNHLPRSPTYRSDVLCGIMMSCSSIQRSMRPDTYCNLRHITTISNLPKVQLFIKQSASRNPHPLAFRAKLHTFPQHSSPTFGSHTLPPTHNML